MEIFITVESLFTMFIMYISDKTGAPKLQGVDARLCFRRMEGPEPTFCDTHVVLVWAIAQMSLHLFFPIRWRILVPAEMLSVVFYMLVLSSSTEGLSDAATTWVMSTVLVAVCAMGKRRLEYQERLSMLMFISEKTLRFQSEFILSQAQLQKKDPSPSSEASLAIDTRSLASAPLSQYIFGKDGEMELDVQLQAILQLGKVEHWIIEPSQLRCFPEVLLGRGVFGVVILGDLCGAATAVKLPFAKQALALDDLSNEIRILRRIRHPNIVGFHGVCVLTSLQVMVLVEEYIHGRSMASQMKDKKTLVSDAKCHGILLDVCNALLYLHSLKPTVAHGDLKPSNVVLEQGTLRAKLIDFGLSRIQDPWSRPLGGSLSYMAPEVVNGFQVVAGFGGGQGHGSGTTSFAGSTNPTREFNKMFCSDMFSYGRLAFFVATRKHPLVGSPKEAIFAAASAGQLLKLDWPEELSPWQAFCQRLSRRCSYLDPTARAQAPEVQNLLYECRPAADASSDDFNLWSLGSTQVPSSSPLTSSRPASSGISEAFEEAARKYSKTKERVASEPAADPLADVPAAEPIEPDEPDIEPSIEQIRDVLSSFRLAL
ncbi:unnamed protein product [Polarella glacialis]|uniref:Protein kinase domain-containing protein n=3 Tax=Polarella glacialis TaxID=89957 RepID=A0A813GA46_POLGL|nr:unnamed protein product [Polarella glacialis]